jgi:hypothetical protein
MWVGDLGNEAKNRYFNNFAPNFDGFSAKFLLKRMLKLEFLKLSHLFRV